MKVHRDPSLAPCVVYGLNIDPVIFVTHASIVFTPAAPCGTVPVVYPAYIPLNATV